MSGKKPKWMGGCLIGCAIVVFLGIAAMGSCGWWVWNIREDFDRAVETRTELEERYGGEEAFVPAADGAVPAERMERFLAVRESLAPLCERFQGTFGVFETMREIDEGGDEPGFRDVLGVLRAAVGIGPLLGDFFAARNGALLTNEMGLGEYTYIYVLAYQSWLGHGAARLPDGDDDRRLRTRVRQAFLGMLRAQRRKLTDADAELAAALDAEIAALEDDPQRIPWPGGVPDPVRRSLEPFRERLEATHCPAAAGFDLSRNRRRGLSIQAD